MIRAALYDPDHGQVTEGEEELLSVWRESPRSQLWLTIEGNDLEAERRLLGEEFGFHSFAVSDALRDRHPAKHEEFENETFVLIKGLDASNETTLEFRTIQIALFVGERLLVTRSSGRSRSSEALFDDLIQGIRAQ